jgi:ketosteroid isomerase-like protein
LENFLLSGANRMRAFLKPLTIVSILLTAIICSPCNAQVNAAATDAMARRAHEAYTSAINSNNWNSLIAMLTDDVVFLCPNEPVIVGKTAVRAWSAAYLKDFRIHWEKSVSEFILAGQWAFERYAHKQNDKPKSGGAPVIDTGKGLIIYHHDSDGKWRVARDA